MAGTEGRRPAHPGEAGGGGSVRPTASCDCRTRSPVHVLESQGSETWRTKTRHPVASERLRLLNPPGPLPGEEKTVCYVSVLSLDLVAGSVNVAFFSVCWSSEEKILGKMRGVIPRLCEDGNPGGFSRTKREPSKRECRRHSGSYCSPLHSRRE